MGKVFSLLFATLLLAGTAASQDEGLGLGAILGEPTGIKGKLWITDKHAFDFGFGWTLGGSQLDRFDVNSDNATRFHVHADFLWHDFRLIRAGDRLPVYYGFGLRSNSGAGYDNSIGIRGIAGIAWLVKSIPLDVFLEATPVLQLNPSTRFGLNGGVGARYYFL